MEHDLADIIETFVAKLDVLSDDAYFRQAIAFFVLRELGTRSVERLGVGRYAVAEHLETLATSLRDGEMLAGAKPLRSGGNGTYDPDAPVA